MKKEYILSRQGRAFTLVELLVVISIIALLLSILMPSLGKAREQAKIVVCSSNLRQAGIALRVYSNSFNGYYPASDLGKRPTTEAGPVLPLVLREYGLEAGGSFGCNATKLKPPTNIDLFKNPVPIATEQKYQRFRYLSEQGYAEGSWTLNFLPWKKMKSMFEVYPHLKARNNNDPRMAIAGCETTWFMDDTDPRVSVYVRIIKHESSRKKIQNILWGDGRVEKIREWISPTNGYVTWF